MVAALFLKVIACEIAFREITHLAAESSNLIDLEFVTQGLHDIPKTGGARLQEQIDGVPAGKYDAILLGYGLCGNLTRGLAARHTKLVIPRAHDCITFFLGSRQRYAETAQANPGRYFYTSGWLECLRRRGEKMGPGHVMYLPSPAGTGKASEAYEGWVQKYGEERARYLLDQVSKWTEHYTSGALIEFPFTRGLNLGDQVRAICQHRGWAYEELPGDLALLRRWLEGDWSDADFQVVAPGEIITQDYGERILSSAPGHQSRST